MPPVRSKTSLKTLAPAAKAVALAKSGFRARLNPSDVRPGCIAWMPFATVIAVIHKDFPKCKGKATNGDGVEVVWNGSDKAALNDDLGRPGRRAWNHPCIVIRTEKDGDGDGGEMVWVLGMTSFKGRSLEEKLGKYPKATQRKIAARVVALGEGEKHPLLKEGVVGGELYRSLKVEGAVGAGAGGGEVKGYVKLGTVYKMDWRDLQRFHGRKTGNGSLRLTHESAERLVKLSTAVCRDDWEAGLKMWAGNDEIKKRKPADTKRVCDSDKATKERDERKTSGTTRRDQALKEQAKSSMDTAKTSVNTASISKLQSEYDDQFTPKEKRRLREHDHPASRRDKRIIRTLNQQNLSYETAKVESPMVIEGQLNVNATTTAAAKSTKTDEKNEREKNARESEPEKNARDMKAVKARRVWLKGQFQKKTRRREKRERRLRHGVMCERIRV